MKQYVGDWGEEITFFNWIKLYISISFKIFVQALCFTSYIKINFHHVPKSEATINGSSTTKSSASYDTLNWMKLWSFSALQTEVF